MSENKNIENTNKISRREALGTIGTVLATTAVVGLTSETAEAQTQGFSCVPDKYKVFIVSADPQLRNYNAKIILIDSVNSKRATLTFMREGVAIPTNSIGFGQTTAEIYFSASRYAELRDFLRYEKPIRVDMGGLDFHANIYSGESELIGDLDI
ncbi:MAG: hypothetical protein MUC29_10435 [Pyrinomonadaceae bacterium]|nr:hypothetical protein [Pyrinomonadaceae bacterium]